MVCRVKSWILHYDILRRSLHADDPSSAHFEISFCPLCLASCYLAQLSCASGAEDSHDAKTAIEQHHRVRNKTSHRSHAACRSQCVMLPCNMRVLTSNGEHGARGVRAPHDGENGDDVAKKTIQRYDNTQCRDQDKGKQTIAHNGG